MGRDNAVIDLERPGTFLNSLAEITRKRARAIRWMGNIDSGRS